MKTSRRVFGLGALAALSSAALPTLASAPTAEVRCTATLQIWCRLMLELVRHTPTYSPPVASRTFAYVSIAAYEAMASGQAAMRSLAGQLNGLAAVPQRDGGQTYDDAVVLQATLAAVVQDLFANTGPTGQRALKSVFAKQRALVADTVAAGVVPVSEAYGQSVARQE